MGFLVFSFQFSVFSFQFSVGVGLSLPTKWGVGDGIPPLHRREFKFSAGKEKPI